VIVDEKVARARQFTVGVPVAHAHENLSILVHLGLYGRLPWGHSQVKQVMSIKIRDARFLRGSYMPKTFMPETKWLLYAENVPAPLCRKRIGSYVPEDDIRASFDARPGTPSIDTCQGIGE
jgi:hypothetical protein